jgi:putative hemolysin
MPATSFEIILVILLMLLNGVFSMSEMAVVSARKARLQQRAANGGHRAAAALQLANSPNDFLSTVQVGITLIGTLAGAFGGATIAAELAQHLSRFPFLATHAEGISITVVVVLISYGSLIVGELVPKRIALSNPERIAAAVAIPMRLTAKLLTPAVKFLSWSSDLVLRILPIKAADDRSVTEDEIKLLIEEGAKAGTIETSEQEMVSGVFRLTDRRVTELMTPRNRMVWLNVQDKPERIQETIVAGAVSRFPVCDGALDRVLGIVHVKDLLIRSLSGAALDLEAALRQPVYVQETARAITVMEKFQKSGIHMALVINEHGGVEGVITLEDLIGAIVGDLPAPGEKEEPWWVRQDDGRWLVAGMTPLFELKELLSTDELPHEDEAGVTTLGGLVMAELGRIPSTGDRFTAIGRSFEVVAMERNRVDQVSISDLPQGDTAHPPE